jgi:uncharacterized protein
MAAQPASKVIPALIRFDGPLPPPAVYSPAPERIMSGSPQQTAHNLFESADKRFNSGIWQSEPGKWRVVFSESEFCYIIAGRIIITSDDGSVTTVKAGDAFVSPAGFLGTWDVVEPAKKFYAFYE